MTRNSSCCQRTLTMASDDSAEMEMGGENIADTAAADQDEDFIGSEDDESQMSSPTHPLICCLNSDGRISPRSIMDQEKRLRREIANSNERRRMQSINTGFQSLKALLPKKDGEKMSKAAILQQTAQYLRVLQNEKSQLMQQNFQLKQLLEINTATAAQATTAAASITPTEIIRQSKASPSAATQPRSTRSSTSSLTCTPPSSYDHYTAPPKKRMRFDPDLSDEGICVLSDADSEGKTSSPKTEVVKTTPQQQQLPPPPVSGLLSPSMPTRCPSNSKCGAPLSNINNVIDSASTTPCMIGPVPINGELELIYRDLLDMRLALDRERRTRLVLEDHLRNLEIHRLRQQPANFLDHYITTCNSAQATSTLSIRTNGNLAPTLPLSGGIPPPNGLLMPRLDCAAPMSFPAKPTPIHATPCPSSNSTPIAATTLSPASVCKAALSYSQLYGNPLLAASAAKHSIESLVNGGGGGVHLPTRMSPFTQPTVNAASRQSLQTIVDAIRHLEGEHSFWEASAAKLPHLVGVEPAVQQKQPVCLTAAPDKLSSTPRCSVEQQRHSAVVSSVRC